jgi:hypothetical protein
MTYLPPKVPNPKRDAEARRQTMRRAVSTVLWVLAIPPLIVVLMAFGYSDQAPDFLRDLTIIVDRFFGSPVWQMIGPKT